MSTPTVHSARLNAELYLGKTPAQPVSGDHVPMRDLLAALPSGSLPPIPANFGTAGDFTNDDTATPKAGSWAMLANGPDDSVFKGYQGCGDCDWAASAHVLMQAAKNAGRPIPPFTGLTVVDQYSAYSGYDIKTGANDNGTDMQQSIKWCQTKGFYDDNQAVYLFGKSVSLTPGDITEMWAATYLFEDTKIGVTITTAQMDQFDASKHPVWDYVRGSAEEGGHAIPPMGVSGLISWGTRVGYTPAFIAHQMDEGYAFVLPERYNAVTGETLENFNDADLEQYVVLLAAQKAAA